MPNLELFSLQFISILQVYKACDIIKATQNILLHVTLSNYHRAALDIVLFKTPLLS